MAGASISAPARSAVLAPAWRRHGLYGERKQFGKPLAGSRRCSSSWPTWRRARCRRLMIHRAAAALDAKHPEATTRCAMAKRFATDVGFKVVNDALQLHGGYGYIKEYRSSVICGTARPSDLEGHEIMRVIIARRCWRRPES